MPASLSSSNLLALLVLALLSPLQWSFYLGGALQLTSSQSQKLLLRWTGQAAPLGCAFRQRTFITAASTEAEQQEQEEYETPLKQMQSKHWHCVGISHLIASHRVASHRVVLRCTASHLIASHCCIASYRVALHCIASLAFDCVALFRLRCIALHCIASRCIASHCIASHCLASLHITMRCFALLSTAPTYFPKTHISYPPHFFRISVTFDCEEIDPDDLSELLYEIGTLSVSVEVLSEKKVSSSRIKSCIFHVVSRTYDFIHNP
jgi:hypothetical protein